MWQGGVEKGGGNIEIKIDLYEFNHVVGLFWRSADGEWKGVVNKKFEQGEVQVIRNEGIILLVESPKDHEEE